MQENKTQVLYKFPSNFWPLQPTTRERHVPSMCACARACVCACICSMCHVWISGCERTSCSPHCSSTLISVAVLVLTVHWNACYSVWVCVLMHSKLNLFTSLFLEGSRKGFLITNVHLLVLNFRVCVCVSFCSGRVCTKMIRRWKRTRAKHYRRRSHVRALHTSWSMMRCTR